MITVLVVDDDFMVARIHRGFVDRVDGFEVVGTANSGDQAVAALTEHRPDLILLDLYLPDVFGLDLIARLRAVQPDVDILVITAAREADAVRGAVRQGVVNYLLKPFGFEDLRARLREYARRRASVPDRSPRKPTSTGSWRPARQLVNRLPKGLSQETADLVTAALRATPEATSPPPNAPKRSASPASAPAATWSSTPPKAKPK